MLYIEVVCPLDHPTSDASPFGKAVSKRAAEPTAMITFILWVSQRESK
jgi:hypothetical protein